MKENKPTYNETLDAIRGSRDHWKRMLHGDEPRINTSWAKCPLCCLFDYLKSGCGECPIAMKTGQTICQGTAYKRASCGGSDKDFRDMTDFLTELYIEWLENKPIEVHVIEDTFKVDVPKIDEKPKEWWSDITDSILVSKGPHSSGEHVYVMISNKNGIPLAFLGTDGEIKPCESYETKIEFDRYGGFKVFEKCLKR